MLALTRKVGERIQIGDGIIVTVLKINGVVRLGIEAPDHVQIQRGELCGLEPLAIPERPPQIKIRCARPGSPPWLAAVAVLNAGGTMAEAEAAAENVRHPGRALGSQHQPMV